MRFKEWLLLSEKIEVNGIQFRDKLEALKYIYNNHPASHNLVVSYTEINKIGINPKSTYHTPLGIYFYPLDYVIDKELRVPFAADKPYINVCEIQRPDKMWEMGKKTQPQLGLDVLKKSFSKEEVKKAIIEIDEKKLDIRSNYSTVWLATKIIAKDNPIQWNSNLRKLGIDGFFDNGTGTIHTGEPTQGVVLTANALKVIHVIENPKQLTNETKFIQALQKGNIKAVDYLLDKFAEDISLNNTVGIAAENGHLPLVKHLVEKYKAPIEDAVDDAAKGGYLDIVKYLIEEKNAHVGYHAISSAIEKGHLNIMKYLVEKGNPIYPDAIRTAAGNNQIDALKYLLGDTIAFNGENIKLPPNIHIPKIDKDNIAIEIAAKNGHFDVVKYLISKGAKVKSLDMKEMINRGSTNIIEYLLDIGELSKNYVAEEAARHRNIGLIKYIVKMGAKIDNEVLVVAADYGNLAIVKYLLEELKLDVGFADIQRAILRSANRGVFNTVLYLVNKYPKAGSLALVDAARHARIDIIKHIIEVLKSPTSQFQLDEAADKANEYGHEDILNYLIMKGANKPAYPK